MVNAKNWNFVDRVLDVSFQDKRHKRQAWMVRAYTDCKTAKEDWFKLPRWKMNNGGEDLNAGLIEYNTWMKKYVPSKEQKKLISAAMALMAEGSDSDVAIVSFKTQSLWIKSAASKAGVGVEEFVVSKLSSVINREREEFRGSLHINN